MGQKLERKPNWENILLAQVMQAKSLIFKYGENDCTIWSAKVLKSYSNLEWEPVWRSKREALKLHASSPMEKQVSNVLGSPYPNLLNTKRGDLVQKGIGLKSTLGICIGNKVVFLETIKGICYADLQDCKYSWRI